MQIFSVEGNSQRLDGGAMFGNCPKPVWEKWAPPDEKNRISLACRAMLVREAGGRNVLLEAGIGAFFEPKMKDRFGVVEDEHVLLRSLRALGLGPEDIHVVVLSHLHFDHAGGLLTAWEAGKAPSLVFPNASYVVGARAWERAKKPHARDKASFIPELVGLLEATGKLEIVGDESGDAGGSVASSASSASSARSRVLGPSYSFTFSEGHTPGLMLTRVAGAEMGPVTFMGDLIPGAPWVHLPITMGYDRYPELLIDEKRALLTRVVEEGGWAFFTHDPACAAAKVANTDGKFSATEKRSQLGLATERG